MLGYFPTLTRVESRVRKLTRGRVLDAGCGKGWAWRYFAQNNSVTYAVAVDIWLEGLKEVKKHNLYHDYVLADVRFLPFRDNCFDTVLLLQVIEHLPRAEGEALLARLERIASIIVVGTPVGFLRQPHHLSGWDPKDFTDRGYVVTGYGMTLPCKQISRATCILPIKRKIRNAYQQLAVKIKEVKRAL